MKRRILWMGLICSGMLSCGPKAPQIERFTEDGIEVVVNHLEPYKIPGEPSKLELEELFVIDGEDDNLAAAGLSDLSFFDIDSQGKIYIGQSPRKDAPLLFKFDSEGRFLTSFGTLGQGPGEIQHPEYLAFTPDDELAVMNRGSHRIMFFDTEGALRREIPFALFYYPRRGLVPLTNGNLLVQEVGLTEKRELNGVAVRFLEPDSTVICSIFEYFPDFMKGNVKNNPFTQFPVITTAGETVFVGFDLLGPDIQVYDLNGNLVRTIRRETRSVKTPPGLLNNILDRYPDEVRDQFASSFFIPALFPVHQHMFCDDEGRLYVMTPEKDRESGRNIYDIFNREGLFIARKDLGGYDRLLDLIHAQRLDVKARHGRLYFLRLKESGFKQMVVSEMIWK